VWPALTLAGATETAYRSRLICRDLSASRWRAHARTSARWCVLVTVGAPAVTLNLVIRRAGGHVTLARTWRRRCCCSRGGIDARRRSAAAQRDRAQERARAPRRGRARVASADSDSAVGSLLPVIVTMALREFTVQLCADARDPVVAATAVGSHANVARCCRPRRP